MTLTEVAFTFVFCAPWLAVLAIAKSARFRRIQDPSPYLDDTPLAAHSPAPHPHHDHYDAGHSHTHP